MRGRSTLSASWVTEARAFGDAFPGPRTWLRMSAICRTHSSIRTWKLHMRPQCSPPRPPHTLALKQLRRLGPALAHTRCGSDSTGQQEEGKVHKGAAGWRPVGQGLRDWPGTTLGSEGRVFWGH